MVVCKDCKKIGKHKSQGGTNYLIFAILAVIFFPIAFIYLFSTSGQEYNVCRYCGSKNIVNENNS